MIRKRSNRRTLLYLVLASAALLCLSCARPKKQIVVGSKDSTGQAILAEVIAQHLEHRTDRKVVRTLNLGNTATVYQALMDGAVGIYPEDTGSIQALVLKEAHSFDASTALERVRNEVRRLAQAEVLDPLGIDNAWAIVVRKDDPAETISDAAASKTGWKLGVTSDFNERSDGLAALNQYRLTMGAMTFVGNSKSLYEGLEKGNLSMIAGSMTDWELAKYADLKVLRDDRKVFGFYQTCVLARLDLLANDPRLQPALAELSGKITNSDMQKMEEEVVQNHKTAANVADQFLQRASLK